MLTISDLNLTRRRVAILGAWVALALSIGAYAYLSLAVMHQPFHVGLRHLRFFDLRVYRGAVERMLHGQGLYNTPILLRLGFTYPPAAALLLAPLGVASLHTDEWVVTILSVVALVWALRRAMLVRRPA